MMVEISEKTVTGPTPYGAIPFIVFVGLCILWVMIMTLAMVFQMADWFPSEVTIGDQRFFGSEILILVIQKYLARAMLIAWPILTAIVIFLEFDYRKKLADKSK